MWLLDLILLILLGVLGIASWLKGRQPKLAGQLGPLEGFAGWIGLVGLIWGVVLLLRWISALGIFSFAPGSMLIALAVALVILSLSLIPLSSGPGMEIMKPIAAPGIGGMITSTLHVLFMTPCLFVIADDVRRWWLRRRRGEEAVA